MKVQSAPPGSRANPWWTAALVLALTLACYWPALRGEMLWDDDAHVTRPELRPVAGLWQIWSNVYATHQYYPLLHSAFWIEHRMWGDATLGYHLANVLLHATAACLLALLLRRLNVPGACLAGLLFAVHPVCVESVAWISEQKNTLSQVFYLLAALAYLRFDRDRGQPAATRAYLLATFLFLLALLTKSVTATLPAALLVVFWWQRGRLAWSRDIRPLIPWFIFAIAGGLFTSFVERKLVGAEGAEFDLTLVQRCLLAGRVIWFYLGKLLWPAHLAFMYPHWDAKSAAAGWTGYLVAAVLVTVVLWLLRRRWRGPLAAWLFFVGSLFPVLGFFNVCPFIFSYVADHFQYLASMGVFAALSAGAAGLLGRASPPVRIAGWGVAAALIASLGILSHAESRIYADGPTLYKATLERNPECWLCRNNLGIWYEGRGESKEALFQYEEALRLKGDYAPAHNNLGIVLAKMPGRLDEAIAQYREALRLQPDYAEAHNNLGIAWYNTPGRLNEAVAEYKEALGIKADFAEAHNNLGNAFSRMPDRLEDAVAQYREALRLLPNSADIHFNIALVLLRIPGRENEAADELEAVLRIKPGNGLARRILAQIRASRP